MMRTGQEYVSVAKFDKFMLSYLLFSLCLCIYVCAYLSPLNKVVKRRKIEIVFSFELVKVRFYHIIYIPRLLLV